MSKAHKVNIRSRETQSGGVVVHVYCPSGCFKGYVWGQDVQSITTLVEVLSGAHRADKDPHNLSTARMPPGHEGCVPGDWCGLPSRDDERWHEGGEQ